MDFGSVQSFGERLEIWEGPRDGPCRGQGGKAVLSVEDEGEGIPSKDQTLAMAPFVRLREEESGTGLGLHLVGQTAALHGAQMAMESLNPTGFVVRVSWALPR